MYLIYVCDEAFFIIYVMSITRTNDVFKPDSITNRTLNNNNNNNVRFQIDAPATVNRESSYYYYDYYFFIISSGFVLNVPTCNTYFKRKSFLNSYLNSGITRVPRTFLIRRRQCIILQYADTLIKTE